MSAVKEAGQNKFECPELAKDGFSICLHRDGWNHSNALVTAWQHILQIAIVAVITTYAETSLMASSLLVLEMSSDKSKYPYAKIARTGPHFFF